MRPPRLVPTLALILASACARGHAASSSSPAPLDSPAPLRPCETRELSLDGARLVVQANADGTPASIVVVRAPSSDLAAKAFQTAESDFGVPHPDTRTSLRQFKWGLMQLTDECGRPVMPAPSPTASPE
jgi:hypothetical protein